MRADLILASASPSRADLLRQAGLVDFRIFPSAIDEDKIKQDFLGTPEALALTLAHAKAQAVCPAQPDAWVVAADQILALPQEKTSWRRFDKPERLEEARAMLKILRGQTHFLHNGTVLAKNGETLWQHQSSASLAMRDFSDAFLDAYLAQEEEKIFASVGAYRLEGAGVHLFDSIKGDFFTILGLPLLPLLAALRQHGVVPR